MLLWCVMLCVHSWQEIRVDFEARPIVHQDFHGIRSLLQEVLIYYSPWMRAITFSLSALLALLQVLCRCIGTDRGSIGRAQHWQHDKGLGEVADRYTYPSLCDVT